MSRVIAVLGGTGPEGFGLALRWAQAGETVIIGSRDARRAQDAAEKISAESERRLKSPARKTSLLVPTLICWFSPSPLRATPPCSSNSNPQFAQAAS